MIEFVPSPGGRQWRRVTYGNSSNVSADTYLTPVVTHLPALVDPFATNLHDASNDVKVQEENGATDYGHVIVRQFAAINGVAQTTPMATQTLAGTATIAIFSETAIDGDYAFTVEGSRNNGGPMPLGGFVNTDRDANHDDTSSGLIFW